MKKKLDKDNSTHSNNFVFKSGKTPPKNNNLTAFENDLYAMVKSIEFTNVKSQFLNKLNADVKEITSQRSYLYLQIKQAICTV